MLLISQNFNEMSLMYTVISTLLINQWFSDFVLLAMQRGIPMAKLHGSVVGHRPVASGFKYQSSHA